MEDEMVFISGITSETEVDSAIQNLAAEIGAQLDGQAPDLLLAFLSAPFAQAARRVVDGLLAAFKPGLLLGCTAEGVIGREQEVEEKPAIALLAARLPGVTLMPFLLSPDDLRVTLTERTEFVGCIEASPETRLMIFLADPFSMPMDETLAAFDTCYPGIPLVGGMASGSLRAGGNILFLNDQLTNGGAVGVAIAGPVEVDILVSQGCRPIWRSFTVIDAHKNLIFNLEGRSPLALIQDLVPELSEEDRLLLQNGLFVGKSIKPDQEYLGRGDFLVRGVIGVDPETGAIAIGDTVHDGERIQFHLRDAITAQEDLEMMLLPQTFREPPSGALLFACNGRGTRLYDRPNGDISVIQNYLGGIPLAGFFCAGEIGPVGGKNYLHGHTACLALFRPPLTR